VHAATDITGFGLAGHATEMAAQVRLRMEHTRIPVLPGAREAIARGVSTGANEPNEAHCADRVHLPSSLSSEERQLYFDPQTSGGLLVAIPAEEANEALKRIHAAGDTIAAIIGEAIPGVPGVEVS